MTYARIAGIGSYLPEKVVTNKDLEGMMETSDYATRLKLPSGRE